ncbi:MAG: activator of HSP90 ATPase 1 family protein [Saprospiraceae bacterium]|nr:activator of HSP90 ATPase 1 family protein [Saprospiraceae bacterium]
MARKKINLEYIFRASPAIIYTFVTTPECLVRWYCDDVDINSDIYTFIWSNNAETAYMIDDIEEERVRYKWKNAPDEEYLEFRIYKADVTNETILEITDFCEDDEVQETTDLWNTLMVDMKKESGG